MTPPRKGEINMVCPPDWRQSQTIVNFLQWLAKQRPELINHYCAPMADPFYMEDAEWDSMYLKFLEQHYPDIEVSYKSSTKVSET